MKLECAVFDMDGTIVDNMQYHTQAWLELAARLGCDVTASFFVGMAGRKSEEIIPILLGKTPPAAEMARLVLEKEDNYRALYRPLLAPMPGFLELLARLKRAGKKTAIATAAPPGNRELVLGGLGLALDAVIGAEHAPRGKPAPDIYLAAARALEVEPARCVAFEDARNGVLSARAAGMEVGALLTTESEADLRSAGARWALRDYTALPRELEAALFAS